MGESATKTTDRDSENESPKQKRKNNTSKNTSDSKDPSPNTSAETGNRSDEEDRLFESSDDSTRLSNSTTVKLDVKQIVNELAKLNLKPQNDETLVEDAPDSDWMRIDRQVLKFLLKERDDYYRMKFEHKHCETAKEAKRRNMRMLPLRSEKKMRHDLVMFARSSIPIPLRGWEEYKRVNKIPFSQKHQDRCPEYFDGRVKAHTMRGPIYMDSTSESKLGHPDHDPYTYIDSFSENIEEVANVGKLLCQKEICRIPLRFKLTEALFHARTDGSNWLLCLPWICEIPLTGDTAYFFLANISPKKISLKMKITGNENFTIRPGVKTMEPFSTKALALRYKPQKTQKDPYEYMKIYYIDTKAMEKCRKKFPNKRIEIATHFTGRLVVPVVVMNYENKCSITHNETGPYDSRRGRRARALVATMKKKFDGVENRPAVEDVATAYNIDPRENTDSSDTQTVMRKEQFGLNTEEREEQNKLDKARAAKRASEEKLRPKPDTKKVDRKTSIEKALDSEGFGKGPRNVDAIVLNNDSLDMPIVGHTESRDMPENSKIKDQNTGKTKTWNRKVPRKESSSMAASSDATGTKKKNVVVTKHSTDKGKKTVSREAARKANTDKNKKHGNKKNKKKNKTKTSEG